VLHEFFDLIEKLQGFPLLAGRGQGGRDRYQGAIVVYTLDVCRKVFTWPETLRTAEISRSCTSL